MRDKHRADHFFFPPPLLSGRCVKADAPSDLISLLESEPGLVIAFEAMVPILPPVFSY
jgi:hypothetical protein